MSKKDLTGKKFGRLTVVSDVGRTKGGKILWECVCECGNITTTSTDKLNDGTTRSCGCLMRDIASERCKKQTTHGMARTRLYNIWNKMIYRCENPKTKNYKNYGAKGIRVCDEWHNVVTFCNWALSNGYNDTLTLDRINPYGGYEPSNCRWATQKVQQNNKTNNIIVEYNGKRYTMTEFCEAHGFNYELFRRQYHKTGDVVATINKFKKER